MRKTDNKFDFKHTVHVNKIFEPFPELDCKRGLAEGIFVHCSHYRLGYLFTDAGNPVTALLLIEGAADIGNMASDMSRVLSEESTAELMERAGVEPSHFDPVYNCFGHCFADSKFRIADPRPILRDDYIECDEAEATLVIAFDDDFPTFGLPLKLVRGKYRAKSGVLGIEEFDHWQEALTEVRHDYVRFYRPK